MGGLTVVSINCIIGGANSFGVFFPSYAQHLSREGSLLVNETEVHLMNSAFWASFTFGRAAAVVLAWLFPRHLKLVMWLQIIATQVGCATLLMFPTSIWCMWAGIVLVGGGVAGLFAAFIGQLSSHLEYDCRVGGAVGVGAMSGIAMWQTLVSLFGVSNLLQVLACSCGTIAVAQILLDCCFFRLQTPRSKAEDLKAEDLGFRV